MVSTTLFLEMSLTIPSHTSGAFIMERFNSLLYMVGAMAMVDVSSPLAVIKVAF